MSEEITGWKGDVHVTLARAWLGLQGSVGLLFALISPMSGWMAGTQDPAYQDMGPFWSMVMFGSLGLSCFGSVGAASMSAAIGLGFRKTWAWWAGVISLALLCFGACFPIGVYGIWALAREEVRKHYGVS